MPATHPTKEQVRAYMRLRECERRPPPRPEEIRRQLGWHHLAGPAETSSMSTLLLPGAMAQLTALLAVHWYFLASGIQQPRQGN